MIKPNDIIKHKEFRDIACLVKSVNGNKAIVTWINMFFEESRFIDFMSQQEITIDNPFDWLICLEPNKKCIRYSRWENLKERKDK